VRHGLGGLAEHAKRYIQIFDKEVSIIDILSLRRRAFPSEEPWFSEYLTARITASFDADEGIFQREQSSEGFGEIPYLNKLLEKVIAQVYSNKISSIRHKAGLRSGDNNHDAKRRRREGIDLRSGYIRQAFLAFKKHTMPHETVPFIVDYAITARTFANARGCLGNFRRWVGVGMTYPIVRAPRRH
jgi:hypothetical protein